MKCPRCESTSYRKNGRRNGKQNYFCKNCRKQFLEPGSSHTEESTFINSSNGHTKTSVAQATEQHSGKLLEAKATDIPDSVSFTLAEEVLQTLLSNEWLESFAFKQSVQKFRQFLEPQAKSELGISILLLDAENLKIALNTETFLASICKYPLQVRIAFANWRNTSMGKQDAELYERGYQLIHVPEGKDSADAKMIALGAGIFHSYPTAKEVFVCSGDRILIHLCNELQNQGLTVYWVRRQAQTLHIENRTTGEFNHYSLAMETDIPSFEEVVQKIECLIKTEQESINARLSNLVTVANLFQERCNLTLNKNKPHLDEHIPIEDKSTQSYEKEDVTISDAATEQINSREELEKVLIEIIKKMQKSSPKTKLYMSTLCKELQKISGQSPNSIIKKLKLGSNFTKFLESCPTLKLEKKGKEYEVAIAQP